MPGFTADAIIKIQARAYVTPAEVRALPLGVSLRQLTDPQLQEYIEVATSNVEEYTERIFSLQEYTETFRGDGSVTHLLREYPITKITSITETDPASGASRTYDIANHLVRTTVNDGCGRIELDGLDPSGINSFYAGYIYKVVYSAGYAFIPVGVKHATKLWVTELIQPDFGKDDAVPLSSQQIIELLDPVRRRRI